MFEGLSVAMVTPFRSGAVDRDAVARLVEHMVAGGVQGIVVSGSTGEAATCTVEERRELWAFVRERAKGRAWIVAGTGTNLPPTPSRSRAWPRNWAWTAPWS